MGKKQCVNISCQNGFSILNMHFWLFLRETKWITSHFIILIYGTVFRYKRFFFTSNTFCLCNLKWFFIEYFNRKYLTFISPLRISFWNCAICKLNLFILLHLLIKLIVWIIYSLIHLGMSNVYRGNRYISKTIWVLFSSNSGNDRNLIWSLDCVIEPQSMYFEATEQVRSTSNDPTRHRPLSAT